MEKHLAYFVPQISDIRVGYEYEWNHMTVGGIFWMGLTEEEQKLDKYKTVDPHLPCWKKEVFTGQLGDVQTVFDDTTLSLKLIAEKIKTGQIRTLFLTKEQIEAEEGIAPEKELGSDRAGYKKGNHWLSYNFKSRTLSVIPIDPVKEEEYWEAVRFIGKVPSINEFRYILKLLHI